jgi:hypothetical protein
VKPDDTHMELIGFFGLFFFLLLLTQDEDRTSHRQNYYR